MADETQKNTEDAGAPQDAEALRARAGTYGFLSRVLSNDEITLDFLRELAAWDAQTGTELDAFAAELSGLDDEGLEQERRALAADHSSLLLGMSSTSVSPYESVHLDAEHLMMGRSRTEVVHAYAEAGFVCEGPDHIPEDHISIELAFCSALLESAADRVERAQEADARRDGDEAARELRAAKRQSQMQADFLRGHLLRWAFNFCDLLEARAQTAFYRGVAQMLRAFLELESEEMSF